MAEEVINITVIDPSVDDVIFKLNKARDMSRSMRQMTLFGEPLSSGKLLDIIPSVTRAQRLIITQIPGMREALMLAYRGRMMLQAGAPVAAGVAVIYLMRYIQQMQQDIDRNREQYEVLIREGLGLTHKEYEEFMKTYEAQQQVGFKSTFDRFFVEKMGTFRELVAVWVAEIVAQVGPFIAAPGESVTGVPGWVQTGMETEEWTSWGREQELDTTE